MGKKQKSEEDQYQEDAREDKQGGYDKPGSGHRERSPRKNAKEKKGHDASDPNDLPLPTLDETEVTGSTRRPALVIDPSLLARS